MKMEIRALRLYALKFQRSVLLSTAVRKSFLDLNRDVKSWQWVEGARKLRVGGCRFSLFLCKSWKVEVLGERKSHWLQWYKYHPQQPSGIDQYPYCSLATLLFTIQWLHFHHCVYRLSFQSNSGKLWWKQKSDSTTHTRKIFIFSNL